MLAWSQMSSGAVSYGTYLPQERKWRQQLSTGAGEYHKIIIQAEGNKDMTLIKTLLCLKRERIGNAYLRMCSCS